MQNKRSVFQFSLQHKNTTRIYNDTHQKEKKNDFLQAKSNKKNIEDYL